MSDVYRISLTDYNGRYITCEDEIEHLGPWLIRTLRRLKGGCQTSSYAPPIEVRDFAKVN